MPRLMPPAHPTIRCDHCHWHYMAPAEGPDSAFHCPRCGHRWRHSLHTLNKSWALILSALILFIPANLLPITRLTYLGHTTDDTIFSGVILLADEGMVPIAVIVFTASILIPLAKIGGMLIILGSVQFRLRWLSSRKLMQLYRVIDHIGRWSLLDLYVITLLIALMNMGQIATFVPGPGSTAFAAVILLSVWGTDTFDTRLLWQAADDCL